MENVENEVRAVEKLCKPGTHKNIVAVLRHGNLHSSYYFLDMELCDLNLESWIERKWDQRIEPELRYFMANAPSRMRLGQIWDIMEDITIGAAYIHSKQEVHRDLKPRNSAPRL
jgi:serine/threonine protein kinase